MILELFIFRKIDRWTNYARVASENSRFSTFGFILWGYLKYRVYWSNPENRDGLRWKIIPEAVAIPKDMCPNAILQQDWLLPTNEWRTIWTFIVNLLILWNTPYPKWKTIGTHFEKATERALNPSISTPLFLGPVVARVSLEITFNSSLRSILKICASLLCVSS